MYTVSASFSVWISTLEKSCWLMLRGEERRRASYGYANKMGFHRSGPLAGCNSLLDVFGDWGCPATSATNRWSGFRRSRTPTCAALRLAVARELRAGRKPNAYETFTATSSAGGKSNFRPQS